MRGTFAGLVLVLVLAGCNSIVPPTPTPGPTRSVSGQVTDATTGGPVAGVQVYAATAGGPIVGVDPTVVLRLTDADGRYTVDIPDQGGIQLRFWWPCYQQTVVDVGRQGDTDASLRPRADVLPWAKTSPDVYRVSGSAYRLSDDRSLTNTCVSLFPLDDNVTPPGLEHPLTFLAREATYDVAWPRWYSLDVEFYHAGCKSTKGTFEWDWSPPTDPQMPRGPTQPTPSNGEGGPSFGGRGVETGPGPAVWGSGAPSNDTAYFARSVKMDCSVSETIGDRGTPTPPCTTNVGTLSVSVSVTTYGRTPIVVDGVERGANVYSTRALPAGPHTVTLQYPNRPAERVNFDLAPCGVEKIQR